MDIKFKAAWSRDFQQEQEIEGGKGYLLLKVDPRYLKETYADFKKLNNIQTGNGELKELDIKIHVPLKERTLDQNKLMWALYRVMANEHNAGIKGAQGQMIEPEDLYNDDLLNYAPRYSVDVPRKLYGWARQRYTIVKTVAIPEREIFRVYTIKSSSEFDTREMAKWIEMLFIRLAEDGVKFTKSSQIKTYWLEFRKNLDQKSIILHNHPMTIVDYKQFNPVCEADPAEYIGHGGGDIAHIRTVASDHGYRKFEGKLIFPDNVFHLCRKHHTEQHNIGWEDFIKKYPHLKKKVHRSLSSRFPQFPEDDISSVQILALHPESDKWSIIPRGKLAPDHVEISRMDDIDVIRRALHDASQNGDLPGELISDVCGITGLKPVEIHERYLRK